ncbi:MAG: lysine 2,3-aminomutase, partial [Actinomycetota bacterium]
HDPLEQPQQVVGAGRHLALMAHYSHPVELSTDVAVDAVRRVVDTGAVVRCQAPLIRHVNDSAQAWADLVRAEVRLGAVPYYQFVERDTGAKRYFEVPLVRAYEIYTEAYRQVSGLARTFRGPVMSADPGKVLVDGIADVNGERVFVLKLLQGRNAEWVNRVFFARYDEKAAWFDELKPAFGETEFFFEREG